MGSDILGLSVVAGQAILLQAPAMKAG